MGPGFRFQPRGVSSLSIDCVNKLDRPRRGARRCQQHTMRVLLLDPKTGLYFQAESAWTMDPQQARDFGTSFRAGAFAQDHGLAHLEVFLDFGDQEYNVRLPLQAAI